VGVGTSTDFLAHALAVAGLAHGNHGAGVQALVWVAMWLLAATISLLPFVPAVWPSGSVESGWLRRLTPVAVAAAGAVTLALAFAPAHLTGVGPALRPVPNPAGDTRRGRRRIGGHHGGHAGDRRLHGSGACRCDRSVPAGRCWPAQRSAAAGVGDRRAAGRASGRRAARGDP
jgi:hypothetical protein